MNKYFKKSVNRNHWILLFIVLLIGSRSLNSQSTAIEKYHSIISEPSWIVDQNIVYIATLNSGGFYGVGGFNPAVNFGGISSINLWRLSENGDTLWTKRLNTSDNGGNPLSWAPVDAVLAPDGGMYILFIKYLGGTNYNGVVKVNANGEILWNTPVSTLDAWANAFFEKIILTSDGSCIAVGATSFAPTLPNLVKVQSNGQIQWNSKNFPSDTGYNKIHALFEASDGNLFATGLIHNNLNGRSRMFVSKLDSKGAEIWSKTFNAGLFTVGDSIKSEGFGIAATSDGGCMATGFQTEPGNWKRDAFIIRLDKNGTRIWDKHLFKDVANNASGRTILKSKDNNYYVYASTNAGYTDDNPNIIKLTEDGAILWRQSGYYKYYGWNSYPCGIDQENRLFFCGSAVPPDHNKAVFIRTTTCGVFRAPNLFTPWNNQINVPLETDLTLQGPYVHQYRKFRYQLSFDSAFSNIAADYVNITDDTFHVTGLKPNTTYFWRVQGFGADENGTPWSSIFKFTTVNRVGVNDIGSEAEDYIKVLPNPVKDAKVVVQLELSRGGITEIELYDVNANHVIQSYEFGNLGSGLQEISMDISRFLAGPYLVILKIDRNITARTSLIKL